MADNAIGERLWTAKEAGDYLGLAEGTVRNKANAGELPFERLGPTPSSPLRFRKADLDAWLAAQKVSA
jgi:excisionase family DNA binding protein